MRCPLATVFVAVIGLAGAATGQTRSDTTKIALASARWMQLELSGFSPVALEYGATKSALARIDDARAVAPLLRATPVPAGSVFSCPTGNGSCTLGKYRAALTLNVERILPRKATVFVMLRQRTTSARTPVITRAWWIQLVRSGSGWSFDRVLRVLEP